MVSPLKALLVGAGSQEFRDFSPLPSVRFVEFDQAPVLLRGPWALCKTKESVIRLWWLRSKRATTYAPV